MPVTHSQYVGNNAVASTALDERIQCSTGNGDKDDDSNDDDEDESDDDVDDGSDDDDDDDDNHETK